MCNVYRRRFCSHFQGLAAAQFLCHAEANINTFRRQWPLLLASAPCMYGATANTLITRRQMRQKKFQEFFGILACTYISHGRIKYKVMGGALNYVLSENCT